MKRTEEFKNKSIYLPKKKEESQAMLFAKYMIKKDGMKKVEPIAGEDSQRLIRNAALSASVSPYLRAVIMVGESDSHYYLSVLEPSEEKLHPTEIIGALINFDTAALPIKEEKMNYYIKPKGLTTLLTKEVELLNLKNISLANVHHDYVRYFCGQEVLEEVIVFHFMQKDFERLEQVIRKV